MRDAKEFLVEILGVMNSFEGSLVVLLGIFEFMFIKIGKSGTYMKIEP